VTRLARQRLHQLAFRHRVLCASRESCTMCRLRHPNFWMPPTSSRHSSRGLTSDL
jgi:hypothetical protein